jgi:hypothetical protein
MGYDQGTGRGSLPLKTVAYGGNTPTSTTPYHSIQFQYELRPDVIPRFASGLEILNLQRLKSVDVVANGTKTVNYELAYEADCLNGESRIKSVTECSALGQKPCKPPLQLTWTQGCDRSSKWAQQSGAATKVQHTWGYVMQRENE